MSDETNLRERGRALPCARCLTQPSPGDLHCRACDGDVSVDVVLADFIADPGARYRFARDLCALLDLPFADVKAALEADSPMCWEGLSFAEAEALCAKLDTLGRASRIVAPHVRDAETLPDVTLAPAPRALSPRTKKHAVIAGAVALVFALGFSAAIMLRGDGAEALGDGATSPREITRRAFASVVRIERASSSGSGFCVTENRLITNAHVVGEQRRDLAVHFKDARAARGHVVMLDEGHDLALVEIDWSACVPLPLGDAMKVEPGDPVVVVGHPRGLEFSVTRGIVAHTDRRVFGSTLFQVDAAVNPGNSGGPVFDDRGIVIGVVTLKDSNGEGLGFAMPVNYLFSGDSPMVTLPEGVDNAAFEARASAAAAEGEASSRELEQTMRRPAIARVVVNDGSIGLTLVYIVAPSRAREARFHFEDERGRRCEAETRLVERTTVPASQLAAVAPALGNVRGRIERAGDSLVEQVLVSFGTCAEHASALVLDDGFPGADRVQMRAR